MAPLDDSQVLQLARCDLAAYAAALDPSFALPWHIDLIIERLEAVDRGGITRLNISMPPRHGKSHTCSILLPAWYLGRHPERQIVICSYSAELAERFGKRVRALVESPLHRRIFPECQIVAESAAAHRLETTRGGGVISVGRGGSLTGYGANLLILDDMIKGREEVASEPIRTSIQDWYVWVARTRLEPISAVVNVGTRWAPDDFTGFLLREYANEGFISLRLPAIAESDETYRRKGEALWPARYPEKALDLIRTNPKSAPNWEGAFQQNPQSLEGVLFHRKWIGEWVTRPVGRRVALSLDAAYKTALHNDFSVITAWLECADGYYLVDLWRDRVEFPELKRTFVRLAEKWRPIVFLVEDSASGQSLIQELKRDTRIPILPVPASSSKIARAHSVTTLFQSGKVFIPATAPWRDGYVSELCAFPGGAHDDMVDSTVQCLRWFLDNPAPTGMTDIEFLRMLEESRSATNPYSRYESESIRGPGPLTLPPGRFGRGGF